MKNLKIVFLLVTAHNLKYIRLYNPLSRKILIIRDVVFLKCQSAIGVKAIIRCKYKFLCLLEPLLMQFSSQLLELHQSTSTTTTTDSSTTSPDLFSSTSRRRNTSSTTLEESSDEPIPLRISTRLIKLNSEYANDMYTTCQFSFAMSVPTHYGEAAKKEE